MSGLKKLFSIKNRKVGFTLAEVLITLGIIGVVAALTMPTLVFNYKKQVIETKLRNSYSMVENIIKMSEVHNGSFTNWTFPTDSTIDGYKNFVETYIKPYINSVDYCIAPTIPSNACLKNMYYEYADGSGKIALPRSYVFKLLDGSFILFPYLFNTTNDPGHVRVYVDLNGPKKPNRSGVDLFVFSLTQKEFFDGYEFLFNNRIVKSRIGFGVYGEMVPRYTDAKNFKCGNTTSWPILDNCAMYIKFNNWKIPKDYPAKI